MKICFPVEKNNGLESMPYGHFGSAPIFLIYDDETKDLKIIDNGDLNHEHGQCQPLKAICGETIDAVLVGGIGGGAIMKLNSMGIRVFRAVQANVLENANFLKEGKLDEITVDQGCNHHGCSH